MGYRANVDGLLDDISYVVGDLEEELYALEEENEDLRNDLENLQKGDNLNDLQHYMLYNCPDGAHVEWDSVLGKWIVDGKMI